MLFFSDGPFFEQNESVLKTDMEIMAEREMAEKHKEEREREAKARKERMKKLEQIAIQKAKKSDEEVARMTREQAIRDAAAIKIDGYSDVVKTLTSMSCRAAAFTLREKQLEEKHQREAAEAEYDRRMDMVMEIDRLKDLTRREEEEKMKRTKRIADRQIITEQMEQRQRQKVLAIEARDQENQSMRDLMKKYEQDDLAAAGRRQVEIERSRAEVIRTNEECIRRKEASKELAKKEIEDILVYQALKDAELQKREEEELALEKAKKERQALLLAQQEKARDNAGRLDEIRARRAAEERERRARTKEKEDAARKKAEMDELLESRARQASAKKQLLVKIKQTEEEEHLATLKHMEALSRREEEEARRKHENAMHHRTQILQQIDESDVKRINDRTSKFAEGTKLRQQSIAEESKYSVIRDQMVKDLAHKGVNERYLSEMMQVNVGKILNR